jgi:hypothetical protein
LMGGDKGAQCVVKGKGVVQRQAFTHIATSTCRSRSRSRVHHPLFVWLNKRIIE